MKSSLASEDSGIRQVTVSNLLSKCGPDAEAAVPLLSVALTDPSVRRLAEGALQRLGDGLTSEEANQFEVRRHGTNAVAYTHLTLPTTDSG